MRNCNKKRSSHLAPQTCIEQGWSQKNLFWWVVWMCSMTSLSKCHVRKCSFVKTFVPFECLITVLSNIGNAPDCSCHERVSISFGPSGLTGLSRMIVFAIFWTHSQNHSTLQQKNVTEHISVVKIICYRGFDSAIDCLCRRILSSHCVFRHLASRFQLWKICTQWYQSFWRQNNVHEWSPTLCQLWLSSFFLRTADGRRWTKMRFSPKVERFQVWVTRRLMSTVLNATSQKWSWKEQLVDSSVGVRNYSAWRNPIRSSKQESAESDAFWQEFCRNSEKQQVTTGLRRCLTRWMTTWLPWVSCQNRWKWSIMKMESQSGVKNRIDAVNQFHDGRPCQSAWNRVPHRFKKPWRKQCWNPGPASVSLGMLRTWWVM